MPDPHVFQFVVEGPSIEDIAVVGARCWFVVYRMIEGGPARLMQRMTLHDAQSEVARLSHDPAVRTACIWQQVCVETWRRDINVPWEG